MAAIQGQAPEKRTVHYRSRAIDTTTGLRGRVDGHDEVPTEHVCVGRVYVLFRKSLRTVMSSIRNKVGPAA